MKPSFFCLVVFFAFTVFGQSDTSVFFENKTNILEVRGEKIYNYHYQIYPSSMVQRSGYVLIDSTEHVTDLIKSKKGVRYNNQTFKPSLHGKYRLIRDYLEQKEYELSRDLNKTFPYADCPHAIMIRKGYYQGLNWEYTNESCLTQRNRIDAFMMHKKDSLFAVHADYTNRTNEFLNTISTTNLEAAKTLLSTVRSSDDIESGYYKVVLQEMAEQNPALFYAFMETVPKDDRYRYYWFVDRKHYRLLKEFETSSPIQKELKKSKRREVWMGIGGATAVLAELGGIVVGITYLIVRNK